MKDHCADCSRRAFLHKSGLTLAGLGATSLIPTPLVRQAMAANEDKRLLFIFLRGGNDAVNTLIPHGDAEYNATNRPTLYVPPGDAIDLGNGFASLHPALDDLKKVFDDGDLAAIHRVGYQNMSRSHFSGQRIWENGDPTQPTFLFEGWLYRYMREEGLDLNATLPALTAPNGGVLMRGVPPYHVNVRNPDQFDYTYGPPKSDKFKQSWRDIYSQLPHGTKYRDALQASEIQLLDTLDEYAAWDHTNWNPTDPNTGEYLFPVSAATNPADPSGPGGRKFAAAFYPFFNALKVCVLSLLEGDGLNGTRIAGTELTGFDNHENQGQLAGVHRDRLNVLGYGIRSVQIALSGVATNEPRGYTGIWENTMAVTMSEFGRTSRENGSFGTDHGGSTCVFAAGGPVNGGVYNADGSNWANGDIFAHDNRDLETITDYRSVFWEILRDHMGALPSNADNVFPNYSALSLPELGLIGT